MSLYSLPRVFTHRISTNFNSISQSWEVSRTEMPWPRFGRVTCPRRHGYTRRWTNAQSQSPESCSLFFCVRCHSLLHVIKIKRRSITVAAFSGKPTHGLRAVRCGKQLSATQQEPQQRPSHARPAIPKKHLCTGFIPQHYLHWEKWAYFSYLLMCNFYLNILK